MLTVLLEPNPCLHTVCSPVEEKDFTAVLGMAEEMGMAARRACWKGISALGLSAPQVGDCRRFFLMAGRILVNPEVISRSNARVSGLELCLSKPHFSRYVARPAQVQAKAIMLDKEGNPVWKCLQLRNMDARVFLHELDHLDGVNIWDRR